MFQSRRTFENEKLQLQDLNQRLGQYLSRVNQLEQENAFLAKEINTVRQEKTVERENQHMAELRELRRVVNQLSFEKERAEIERDKLWRELQVVQEMCNKESGMCRNIEGEVKGCEKQLHQTLRTNQALEERLFQLENECQILEDAQRQELAHVRNQVYSRATPVYVRQNYQAPTAFTAEEIEEYAQTLSDSWTQNFEIYERKIEELEEGIRADEAKLEDLHRESMQYAAELKKLKSESEKQNQLHAHLEEQIMHMQDSCHMELDHYQAMVQELEDERQALAAAIAEKLRDHQELMQVKMGLGLEVAAYRALLEGGSEDVSFWTDQRSRGTSRITDVKAPASSYPLKGSMVNRQDMKRHPATSPAFNIRYMEPKSSLRTLSGSSHLRSNMTSSSTTAPRRANRSPLARRDMLSFTVAARQAATASSAAPAIPVAKERGSGIQKKTTVYETIVRSKEPSQNTAKDLEHDQQSGASEEYKPKSAGMKPDVEFAGRSSVRVVSPPMMSLVSDTAMEDDSRKVQDVKVVKVKEMELKAETIPNKMAAPPSSADVRSSQKHTGRTKDHLDRSQPEGDIVCKSQTGPEWDFDEADTGEEMFPEEQKVLHSISMEDIIETVVKPVGLDTKLMSSPDSKVTYHVEKMEGEDGTTKTKIVLQSKVQEELDMSDESALEELLSHGGKTVTLEDIKGTPTGDMIENLLSLGLQDGGVTLENKSVNVEIIEEPAEDHSDEEIEEKPASKAFQPSSMFFQIEELEDAPESSQLSEGSTEAKNVYVAAGGYQKAEFGTFPEGTRDSHYYTQVQETEYFVSTPEENISGPEEEGDIPSYGRYGTEEDWSDGRYYQQEGPPENARGDYPPNGDRFPEYVIKEEIRVSPSVQETMLEILKQDSLDTKEQLKGALEKLHGTVSGPLQEDLDLFMRGDGAEQLDIRKVQQSSDNGTVTIVAELNVSQTLEDSGLLEQAAGVSREQIMGAVRSGDQNLQQAVSTRQGYTVRVLEEEDDTPWIGIEGQGGGCPEESVTEISKTEKHIQLGPSEKSFTFQMDVGEVATAATASDGNQHA